MQVAKNADIYAEQRQNIFFKGVTPDLDGQCVSLVKWFMQQMSKVPNPQAARGDARYVGDTLVRQGHAVEVPYSKRKRGDIVCYVYGVYGHIAVQLSGGRVFEQNVNMGGVKSKIVDGQRVYASRIGSEKEAWRKDKNPHVYRLKTYKEIKEDEMLTTHQYNLLCRVYLGRAGKTPKKYVGKYTFEKFEAYLQTTAEYKARVADSKNGKLEAQNHLLKGLRSVYKTPEAKVLEKGTYQVK